MLSLLVSLTKSRLLYDVPAAQLPRYSPINSPIVGLPLASNANVLLARTVLIGSVMLIVVGSVTGARNARAVSSATCCTKMVWLSSSSFSVFAKRSPPVTKSVTRSILLAPTIVIRSDAIGVVGTLVPTTIVTEPVPSTALTVTV